MYKAFEVDFTVEVGAGNRDCFHQHIKKGSSFEIEYQVIDGGDLDVNFVIKDPGGKVLLTDIRKTDDLHKLEAKEDGDYAFCLDNTFSRFSKKLVFFELVTDEEEEADDTDQMLGLPDESAYEMKVEDLKDSFDRIKGRLEKSAQLQNVLRAIEARGRSLAEDSFTRVNFWSGVQLFVMVSVVMTHVLMIRGLFEDKSKGGPTKICT